jgi:hypothetical protein
VTAFSRPRCQVAGCRSLAVQCHELDLPGAWEGEARYTTLPVHVGLCRSHGREVGQRTAAMLEARVIYAHLLQVVDEAVRDEAKQRQALAAAEIEAEVARDELAILRQERRDAQAALRLVAREDGVCVYVAGGAGS